MARSIQIDRAEAEILSSLLMLTDDKRVEELGVEIRELFGMVSQERELDACGLTLPQFRTRFCVRLLGKLWLKT